MGAMSRTSRTASGPDAGVQGLTTARLKLRRFSRDDLPFLQRLHRDPEVMRYVGGVKTAEQTRKMLEKRILAYYRAHPGLGVWATLLRDSGECIGLHLLNHIQGETIVQVGYVLTSAHWGQGYASEMCVALLRYGFANLRLPTISGITERENVPSQRVLQKAGLRRIGERVFSHPAYASSGPLAYFERAAAEWLGDREAADGQPVQGVIA